MRPGPNGSRRGGRGRARRIVALGSMAVAILLALPAGVVLAHAGGGELMYVWWEPADGHDVHGQFTAPPDDAALIGESLGLLRPGAMEAFLGGPEADYPTDAERAALSQAPALHSYLEDRIEVIQDGAPCPGRVEVEDDFIADGARLSFTCPEPVTTATVRITVLHDEDPDFRTFSGDGTLQDAVHTAEQPAHPWDFTAAAAADRASMPPLALVIGLVLVVVVGVVTVLLLRPGARERA